MSPSLTGIVAPIQGAPNGIGKATALELAVRDAQVFVGRPLVQRVSSAFGLAMLTAIVTANQAQLKADRSALLQARGADADPRIVAMQAQGPAGLIPLWQQLTLRVEAESYRNAFFLAGCATLAAVVLALFLRPGAQAAEAKTPTVH